MNNQEQNIEKKKAVANEIVNAFKKIKISLLIGLIYFIVFSIYNKLFQYTFLDYNFSCIEAEQILGYKPSQYNLTVNNDENINDSLQIEDGKFLDSIANTDEFKKWSKKKIAVEKNDVVENNAVEKEVHTGNIEISNEGRLEVKKNIIVKLLENSLIFTSVMIIITFIVLLLIHYIKKVINWTKKYAD